eukprot:3024673-Amphidinium_carterae.1
MSLAYNLWHNALCQGARCGNGRQWASAHQIQNHSIQASCPIVQRCCLSAADFLGWCYLGFSTAAIRAL